MQTGSRLGSQKSNPGLLGLRSKSACAVLRRSPENGRPLPAVGRSPVGSVWRRSVGHRGSCLIGLSLHSQRAAQPTSVPCGRPPVGLLRPSVSQTAGGLLGVRNRWFAARFGLHLVRETAQNSSDSGS
jgi:hypothetical protein